MEKSTIDIFIEKGIPYCYESCECNSCKRNDITGGKERKHERNHEVYQPDSSDWRSGLQQQIERLWNRPLPASLYHSDLQGTRNRTGKISREICVNKSNVTRQLATLEEKGLITRQQDMEDRRVWRVYPTEKMQELLPCVRSVMREWNEYLLEELSEEERETLVQLLEKVTKRANEAAQNTLSGRDKQP